MNFSKNLRLKHRGKSGKWSYYTQLYWSSNYDPHSVFQNYPNLTYYQEIQLTLMFNSIINYKSKSSKGNVFPILP